MDPNDLQVDVYRSSGPGGQSVNTTDSAVRITHKPTGLVVSMQDEKSQLQNREKAMRVLRARLLERELAAQQAELAADRKAQVGTGERSEKIRTYNFPQDRVTDHRVKLTKGDVERVLAGELDDFTAALEADEKRRKLEAGALVTGVTVREVLDARRAGARPPRAATPRGSTPSCWWPTRSAWTARRWSTEPERADAAGRGAAARRSGSAGAGRASRWPTSSGARASAASSWRWTRAC